MYNLTKKIKVIIFLPIPIVFLVIISSVVYSFDSTDLNLATFTNFLDSLKYNYKGFDIKFKSFKVGETFDDNILYTKSNKQEDFITNINLGVSAKYEGKRNTLEVVGNLYNDIYAKNDNFTSAAEDLVVNFKSELSKNDHISLSDVFSHTYVPLSFDPQFFNNQFGRPGGRFAYYKNLFHLDYTKDISRQITTSIKYDNELDDFPNNIIMNSILNKPTFETAYLLSSSTTFFLTYSFENRRFENDRNASINTVTPGIRQYFTKKIYLDARTGVDFIDSYDDQSLIKPVIQTSITYEMDVNTVAVLSYDKKYGTSPYSDSIFNRWQTAITLKRQLLERVGLNLSMFYGDGDYVSLNNTQRLLGINSGLSYDINKNLKGNLTYAHSESDSNVENGSYTKNTMFLGLSASF